MKLFYLALSLIFFFIPFSILGETMSDLIWNNGLYYKKGSKTPFDGIVTWEINGSFKNGKKHRFGWPKNYKINGPFWTNSTDKKEMEKVLKNLFLMSSTKWSIIKKKYINDVISYDFKNRRLIKKLNRIFEI